MGKKKEKVEVDTKLTNDEIEENELDNDEKKQLFLEKKTPVVKTRKQQQAQQVLVYDSRVDQILEEKEQKLKLKEVKKQQKILIDQEKTVKKAEKQKQLQEKLSQIDDLQKKTDELSQTICDFIKQGNFKSVLNQKTEELDHKKNDEQKIADQKMQQQNYQLYQSNLDKLNVIQKTLQNKLDKIRI